MRQQKLLFEQWRHYKAKEVSWEMLPTLAQPVRDEFNSLLLRGSFSGNKKLVGFCNELYPRPEQPNEPVTRARTTIQGIYDDSTISVLAFRWRRCRFQKNRYLRLQNKATCVFRKHHRRPTTVHSNHRRNYVPWSIEGIKSYDKFLLSIIADNRPQTPRPKS